MEYCMAPTDDLEAAGLAEPRARVTIASKAETVELEIGAAANREVHVRRADSFNVFHPEPERLWEELTMSGRIYASVPQPPPHLGPGGGVAGHQASQLSRLQGAVHLAAGDASSQA